MEDGVRIEPKDFCYRTLQALETYRSETNWHVRQQLKPDEDED